MSVRFLLLWVAAIAIMIATHNSSSAHPTTVPSAAAAAAVPFGIDRPNGSAPQSRRQGA